MDKTEKRKNYSLFCQICGEVGRLKRKASIHEATGMILCSRHKAQYRRHGKLAEQTRFEKNKVEFKGDECWLGLNNSKGEIIAWCIIDSEDYEKVKDYKWFMRKDGRVITNVRSLDIGVTHLRIHNVIMDFDDELKYKSEIDHIDCNSLNNKKSNLRIVTKSKNLMNRRLQCNNATGVAGVVSTKHNNTPPWSPSIKINRKTTRLGTERSFDEAVKKRIIAESQFFKEHSNNYNPETNTLQLTYLSHDDNLQTHIECTLQGEIIKFTKPA